MKNEILEVQGTLYDRVLVADDRLYLFISKYKSLEEVQAKAAEGGKLDGIKSYNFTDINKIQFNESYSTTTIYHTLKGKEKKLKLDFKTEDLSNDFGNFLGGELMLVQEMANEKRLPKLIGTGILCVFCIGLFVYLINESNYQSFLEMDNSNSRSGRKAAFLKIIFDMLGHTGALGVSFLAAAILGWTAYTEYKQPSKVMTYFRV